VFAVADETYGSIGPAFYGLRTSVAALLLMALTRTKRPEGLKEQPPDDLGRALGLDRAPEVKAIRRKLGRLASFGRTSDFGRELARQRVAARVAATGFLCVDAHVRVYHGQRVLPKAHVARMRITMPATTDYWVNDAPGDPLLVLTAEANAGLVAILPAIIADIRKIVGERRVGRRTRPAPDLRFVRRTRGAERSPLREFLGDALPPGGHTCFPQYESFFGQSAMTGDHASEVDLLRRDAIVARCAWRSGRSLAGPRRAKQADRAKFLDFCCNSSEGCCTNSAARSGGSLSRTFERLLLSGRSPCVSSVPQTATISSGDFAKGPLSQRL
jgi:hypothetical protein